jgi:parallel beta-helix repeat protein
MLEHNKLFSMLVVLVLLVSTLNVEHFCVAQSTSTNSGINGASVTPTIFSWVQADIFSNFTGTAAVEWEQYFGDIGTNRYDTVKFIVQTSDSGYAMAAENIPRVGTKFVVIVKTDSSGVFQWAKKYDMYGLAGFAYTNDGGYVLAGNLNLQHEDWFTISVGNVTLLKTDPNGEVQWSQKYPFDDSVSAMVQTSDGGYALAGKKDTQVWILKVDSAGKQQWNWTLGVQLDGWKGLAQIIQTSDGGYAIAGTAPSDSAGETDFLLLKTSSTGELLWSKKYGGVSNDSANSLIQTSDGGYALVGSTESFDLGGPLLIKTDASGNVEWARTYGSTGTADYLIQTSDGGLLFVGSNYRVWLVKTDASGKIEWNQTYGGQRMAQDGYLGKCVIENGDGGFTAAGSWMLSGSVIWYYLVKTQPILLPSTSPSLAPSPSPAQILTFPPTTITEDGSVNPAVAPIQHDGNVYTFTSNLIGSLVVERDNIVIDGTGFSLHGNGTSGNLVIKSSRIGMDLTGRTNVTIKNLQIYNYTNGIHLNGSTNVSVLANNLRQNGQTILVANSAFVTISANSIENNNNGILIKASFNNEIAENSFSHSSVSISDDSSGNVIFDNTIRFSDVFLETGSNNLIVGNEIYGNFYGIFIGGMEQTSGNIIAGNNFSDCRFNVAGNIQGNNLIYMNNFENSTYSLWKSSFGNEGNSWDNGTAGNYYSDYTEKYPNASKTEGAGTWNTPYTP